MTNPPIDDGGPAFPFLESREEYDEYRDRAVTREVLHPGMSLRDWFAGHIATNLFNGREYTVGSGGFSPRVYTTVAAEAYKFADAMLKARNQ